MRHGIHVVKQDTVVGQLIEKRRLVRANDLFERVVFLDHNHHMVIFGNIGPAAARARDENHRQAGPSNEFGQGASSSARTSAESA
jgi:hypothetical protein